MLILASTTDKLRLFTASAGTIDVHASWMDNVSGAVQPGRTNTPAITAATTTDIVGSPASGVFRNIKTVHVHNRGTTPNTVAMLHTDGATTVELHRAAVAAGDTLQYIDEVGFIAGVQDTSAPRGHIFGLQMLPAPTAVQVNPGEAASTVTGTDRPALMSLAVPILKNLVGPWAPGSSAGGLDTGAVAASTTYHVHLIQSNTGVVDFLFSLSATTPTMPANYIRRRRIGAIMTTASSTIRPFRQLHDNFWAEDLQILNSTTPFTNAQIGSGGPNGIFSIPMLRFVMQAATGGDYIIVLYQTDDGVNPNTIGFMYPISANLAADRNTSDVMGPRAHTNNSMIIMTQQVAGGTLIVTTVTNIGWIDYRDKDA